jgi:hypothetical protein
MKEFFMSNWASLLVILAFVAILVILAVRGKKDIVGKILYALVTEAEKIYGSGTGSVKFAYVVEKAYSYFPAILKIFITYERLKQMIEESLAAAKIMWATEAGISDYLKETELLVGEPANVGAAPDNEK